MLPTIAEQVLEEMDTGYLTKELQNRFKARHSRQLQQRPPSSLASSIETVNEHETQSEGGPAGEGGENSPSSWVESTPPSSAMSSVPRDGSPEGMGSQLSVSLTTNGSSANGDAASIDGSALLCAFRISPHATLLNQPSPKASSVLLSSPTLVIPVRKPNYGTKRRSLVRSLSLTIHIPNLTPDSDYPHTDDVILNNPPLITIQLTLLARSKYIHSVFQQEHDERFREQLESEFTMSNILLGGSKGLDDLISGVKAREEEGDEYKISEELENKVEGRRRTGEKGCGGGVDGVSLKTKLSLMDLRHLIRDIRRRIEHEITFEGNERRTTFLSTLLPPTPETTHHVLIQGGFPYTPHTPQPPPK
ncbi:hypothetical protein K443DRAFT_6029 [Laccaria amethystina LaAM-08-1]|uniref:Unplaced genomic scaffold K443scaffold_277, whole genome shotgun sequence n=1 Tax=Laccaria amethystina LaAM-08-1 TaxID=1095629 RepID=A0A0C9WYL9_9AGAR|nr:hypothetical protein K443DRAFT_12428 [Laccaria amethystina LaAM-08-1]KIK02517.1 hypothetical protein K443DRAFT_6029 [Laccaria amethystina LaAM-08-1]